MGGVLSSLRRWAPQLLGCSRLLFGGASLVAPGTVARRLGVDPDANPAPIHPLRMFGIRTVIIGAELLIGSPATRARSVRLAPLIHASDTLSAGLAGLHRQLPPRPAITATLISAGNTCLALLAQDRGGRRRPRRR